ncbi:MAG TPA: hypothetical protein VMH22_12060 [bacterium]|nr:hypothetical protein [bacterium]
MGSKRPDGTGRRTQTAVAGHHRLFLPLLLGIYVVFSLLLFDPKPATFGDNAIYLTLGKSLAAGKGYRDLYLPDAPVHTQYPPGFPLMLAGITLLTGGRHSPTGATPTTVLFAKLFVLLTGVGAMFFIYRLCRLTFQEKAWPIMAVFASMPAFVVNNHWVLSELPFMLATFAALYCLVLAEVRPKATAARLRILAGGLAVAACYIRTAGLAVVLSLLLLFLVRRQYRDLVILLLLFAATVVPWQVLNARAGRGQPYLEQLLAKHPYFLELGRAGFGDWASRIWLNLRDYSSRAVPRLLCPTYEGSNYEVVCGIIVSLVSAVGFGRAVRRMAARGPGQLGPLTACALCAIPLLLGWPNTWASERFLLPFLPLIVIFFFQGVEWFGARLRWRWLGATVVGVLVFANTVQMTSLAHKAVRDNLGYLRGDRYSGYPEDWRRYFEAIEWIKLQTPPDAVVMARKPEFVYLLSGRRSFCYPITPDHAKVKSAIERSQYVLADNFRWTETTPMLLSPVLQENQGLWSLIFSTPPPEFYVLSVKPGAPAVSQPTSAGR